MHDEGREGQLVEASTDNTHVTLNTDRRQTLHELHFTLLEEHCIQVSESTLSRMLREEGYRTICAWWVPRELTPVHKQQHLEAANEFLMRYNADPTILECTVTCDETWIHFRTPSTKEALKMWKKKDEPAPKKFRCEKSANEFMASVFWDCHGIIHVEWMQCGTTITAKTYTALLKVVRKRIKDRKPGLLSKDAFTLANKMLANKRGK